MVERQVVELLQGVPKTATSESTPRDRPHRLDHLVSGVLRISKRLEERGDAIDSIGRGEDEADERQNPGGYDHRHMPPSCAGRQHHEHRHRHHQSGGAEILLGDQGADDCGEDDRRCEAREEMPHAVDVSDAMPRDDRRQPPLGDLARLESNGPEPKPPGRTVRLFTDDEGHEQEPHDRGEEPGGGREEAAERRETLDRHKGTHEQSPQRQERQATILPEQGVEDATSSEHARGAFRVVHDVGPGMRVLVDANGRFGPGERRETGRGHHHHPEDEEGEHQKCDDLSSTHGCVIDHPRSDVRFLATDSRPLTSSRCDGRSPCRP